MRSASSKLRRLKPLWQVVVIIVLSLLAGAAIAGLKRNVIADAAVLQQHFFLPSPFRRAMPGGAVAGSLRDLTTSSTAMPWRAYSGSSLPRYWVQKGIASYGDMIRPRRVLSKLLRGEPLTIVSVGGSITWGHGVTNRSEDTYSSRLQTWLREAFPGVNHTVLNRGVPAAPSSYMALCAMWHVPPEADLVIVEFNVNDGGARGDLPIRRSHERLLRLLLSYPGRPAVVELAVFRWLTETEIALKTCPIPYRYGGDDELAALAHYYHLPFLSTRSLMFDANASQVPGFARTVWQPDPRHPNSAGHAYLTDMLVGYFQRVLDSLTLDPLDKDDAAGDVIELPAPMLKGNWQSEHNLCHMGQTFKPLMQEQQGFVWVNEGTEDKPKWGWVAKDPGSWLSISINTTKGIHDVAGVAQVQLAFLRSYEHMGVMQVRCASGCACTDETVDGHNGEDQERTSQTSMYRFAATKAEKCVIRVEVLNTTQSGEHKVKILGVIISPDVEDRASTNITALKVDFGTQGGAEFSDVGH